MVKVPVKNFSLEDIAKRNKMNPKLAEWLMSHIKRAMEPKSKRILVAENGEKRYYAVERRGIGILNTKYGKFWEIEFSINDHWENYTAIIKADLDSQELNPVFLDKTHLTLRIDSGCKTGQLFGDLTCECKDQMELALKTISEVGEGMLINIPKQDGRGMGISFKLATLWLQDNLGVDTVESATILAPGGVIDVRTYSGIIGILKFFGVGKETKINLASNNPKKASIFEENGYQLNGLVPVVIKPNKYTKRHLMAKQERLGHIKLI